ncbi:MAG: hypothetical protein ACM3JG_18785 [Thiohalocapsa sp.]
MTQGQVAAIVRKINGALRRVRPRLTEAEAAHILQGAAEEVSCKVFGERETSFIIYPLSDWPNNPASKIYLCPAR